MSLKNWLLRKLAGDDKAKLELSSDEENLSGLNLKTVLDAHMLWKVKLESTLDGSSTEKYEVATVAQDNLCVLGKWLYGPGKKLYSKLPEYEALRKIHASFHLCAGEILVDHNKGNLIVANNKLKREFKDLSGQIQLDLVRLFSTAKAKSKSKP